MRLNLSGQVFIQPIFFADIGIPRRGPFQQVSVSVGNNGTPNSVSGGGGPVSVDARNVLSPHSEEMNIMLAENLDSILGGSTAKIEKGIGRLALVSLGPLFLYLRDI